VEPVNIQICKIQSKKSLAKVFEIFIEGQNFTDLLEMDKKINKPQEPLQNSAPIGAWQYQSAVPNIHKMA
jgi:hypothetical protein